MAIRATKFENCEGKFAPVRRASKTKTGLTLISYSALVPGALVPELLLSRP